MPESSQTLLVAAFTLPGIIGYLIFASLFRREIGDNFEKLSIVAILDLSAIILLSAISDISSLNAVTTEKITFEFIVIFVTKLLAPLTLISVVCAVLVAHILNRNWIQSKLVKIGITNKTSYSSVLSDVICSYPDAFMKFRLKSGGYIIGHPRKYSLHGKECVIFLDQAARRPARRATGLPQPPEVAIAGQGVLLLDFSDVECVEVL